MDTLILWIFYHSMVEKARFFPERNFTDFQLVLDILPGESYDNHIKYF